MATGYQDFNKMRQEALDKQSEAYQKYARDNQFTGRKANDPWLNSAKNDPRILVDGGTPNSTFARFKNKDQIEDENAQNFALASQADAFAQGQANQQGIMDSANQYYNDAYRIGQNAENLPTVDDLVYKNLRGAASGVDVPFNAATQAALMTNASQANQSATNNQLQQLQQQAAMSGANPSDPSYLASMRNAQAQAQGNMQNQRNAVAMQANTANYAAKQQATQGLTNLQSQLANQAIAGRQQALQAYSSGTANKQQALSMPVASMSYDTAKGVQQGGGQAATKAGNYQIPTYQQWTQSNAAKSNPWKQ